MAGCEGLSHTDAHRKWRWAGGGWGEWHSGETTEGDAGTQTFPRSTDGTALAPNLSLHQLSLKCIKASQVNISDGRAG